jgi:hypothetical protein
MLVEAHFVRPLNLGDEPMNEGELWAYVMDPGGASFERSVYVSGSAVCTGTKTVREKVIDRARVEISAIPHANERQLLRILQDREWPLTLYSNEVVS